MISSYFINKKKARQKKKKKLQKYQDALFPGVERALNFFPYNIVFSSP